MTDWMELKERIAELERKVSDLSAAFGHMQERQLEYEEIVNAMRCGLEPVQSAQEPEQQERWDWIDGTGLTYDGVLQDIEIAALLNKHGIKPE